MSFPTVYEVKYISRDHGFLGKIHFKSRYPGKWNFPGKWETLLAAKVALNSELIQRRAQL
jgi:hypothetical protein